MTTRLAFFNWLRKANGEFNARSNDTWMGLSINDFFYDNKNPQIWKQNDVTIETFQRKFNVFYFEWKSFEIAHRREISRSSNAACDHQFS